MGTVSRFLLLSVLATTTFQASAEMSQWEKNSIREAYQEAIFNRPATVRNLPPDQRYMREINDPEPQLDLPSYAPLPELPSVQVFASRELPFELFLRNLSRTLGFKTPDFAHVPVSILQKPIIVNSEFHDLNQLVGWLEVRTGTRIAVYLEAKTIQVTARNGYERSSRQ